MSKGCKCKPTECEECPEWIFTFADLVMLMMGFFVILWVLKPNPTKPSNGADMDPRMVEVFAKIRQAFDYLPDPTSPDPVDMKMILDKLQKLDPMKSKGMGGETTQKPKGPQGTENKTQTIRPGQQSLIGASVRFRPGKTDLSNDGMSALSDIAKKIQGHRQIVIIKGHASMDDFPSDNGLEKEGNKILAQNRMNLSVRRAQVVADYLTNLGVDPVVIRVQGCSTFEPIKQEAYDESQNAQNRRVEVESSDNTVNEVQDNVKTTNVMPPGLKKDLDKESKNDSKTGTAETGTEPAVPH